MVRNLITLLTVIAAFAECFCVACVDTDPYPRWLFPMMIIAGIVIAVGVYLLKNWYFADDDEKEEELWDVWK